MPAPPNAPDSLQRATDLRRLAHRLQMLGVLTLHRLAGDDTWVGSAAQSCHDELVLQTRRVHGEVDRLLAIARRIEYDLSAVP